MEQYSDSPFRSLEERCKDAEIALGLALSREAAKLEPNIYGVVFDVDLKEFLDTEQELEKFLHNYNILNFLHLLQNLAPVYIITVTPSSRIENDGVVLRFRVGTGDEKPVYPHDGVIID
jgi:hypothetical protein